MRVTHAVRVPGPKSSMSTDVHEVRRGPFVVTRLHRTGASPSRVLLIGSRALLAPAGRARSEAFAALVADRLWLRTRRGVDVDVVWELRPVLTAISEGLEAARLWRYDAVVVVIKTHPLGALELWRLRGARQLLRRVVEEVSQATHVLVVAAGADPGGSRRARHAQSSLAVTVPDEVAASRVSRLAATGDERADADAIAERLLGPLAEAGAARESENSVSGLRQLDAAAEAGRQRAVDALGLRGRTVQQRLQDVVNSAKDAFESASAEITIIDRDRQWTMVAAGLRHAEIPRATSLCNRSIERAAPMVIGDLWRDPELRGTPLMEAVEPIRFYASHPIESIDGHRIGVLCVWDAEPHEVEDFDVTALRDLALLAEAEIISAGN